MNITKHKRSQKAFGYFLVIEVKSIEDDESLRSTLNYMIEKKGKSSHAKKGKLISLARLLRDAITY